MMSTSCPAMLQSFTICSPRESGDIEPLFSLVKADTLTGLGNFQKDWFETTSLAVSCVVQSGGGEVALHSVGAEVALQSVGGEETPRESFLHSDATDRFHLGKIRKLDCNETVAISRSPANTKMMRCQLDSYPKDKSAKQLSNKSKFPVSADVACQKAPIKHPGSDSCLPADVACQKVPVKHPGSDSCLPADVACQKVPIKHPGSDSCLSGDVLAHHSFQQMMDGGRAYQRKKFFYPKSNRIKKDCPAVMINSTYEKISGQDGSEFSGNTIGQMCTPASLKRPAPDTIATASDHVKTTPLKLSSSSKSIPTMFQFGSGKKVFVLKTTLKKVEGSVRLEEDEPELSNKHTQHDLR